MLRKEVGELQVIKNQVKEIIRELELLKAQVKANNKVGYAYSSMGSKSSGENLGNMFGNVAMHGNSGSNLKNMAKNNQIFGQLVKTISVTIINQSQRRGSFSQSKEQSQYQQAQNFKNISYKLY